MSGSNNPMYGKHRTEEEKHNLSVTRMGANNVNYQKFGIKHHNAKPVYCFELDKFFGSGQEAMRETGANASGITKCCKGKVEKAGGKHWRYATEQEILKMREEA